VPGAEVEPQVLRHARVVALPQGRVRGHLALRGQLLQVPRVPGFDTIDSVKCQHLGGFDTIDSVKCQQLGINPTHALGECSDQLGPQAHPPETTAVEDSAQTWQAAFPGYSHNNELTCIWPATQMSERGSKDGTCQAPALAAFLLPHGHLLLLAGAVVRLRESQADHTAESATTTSQRNAYSASTALIHRVQARTPPC